jgi:hypothetical protein
MDHLCISVTGTQPNAIMLADWLSEPLSFWERYCTLFHSANAFLSMASYCDYFEMKQLHTFYIDDSPRQKRKIR